MWGIFDYELNLSTIDVFNCVLIGYQPKTGFLQTQIKRLPMLYDEEYRKADQTETGRDNVNNTAGSNSSLEELAMP